MVRQLRVGGGGGNSNDRTVGYLTYDEKWHPLFVLQLAWGEWTFTTGRLRRMHSLLPNQRFPYCDGSTPMLRAVKRDGLDRAPQFVPSSNFHPI
ncbi:Translocating chain-associated membrane protein 1 [Echinococcus multilocularis]|uniref:Translocating chain-associated membrane protein 1 n=1 Tax=Echinococcus multilocularis TaxID=6211 RepID=A0A0S4MQW3_ECHMU|nr:Translocating chain-associated membrane protein 1 [Echinococcus multilocularis]